MENEDIFELLAENKKRREAIIRFLKDTEVYPYLMIGKKPAEKGDFYEPEKKKTGAIVCVDLPTDLGLKKLIINTLKKEHDRLLTEFNSYTIKK
jgi:hypothetical protein